VTFRSTIAIALLLVCPLVVGCGARARPRPAYVPITGPATDWYGYNRYDFELDGRPCTVVAPHRVAPNVPWIWRASFFGQCPDVDLALLERGFHVAFMDVTDLCGSPQAVTLWDAFYADLTQQHGFAPRPALEAISRGALIAYNWAASHPATVAIIVADIPVCDFRSWPGGTGRGVGSPADWRDCLRAYALTEDAALTYAGNPVDNLSPLAVAGVPLFHVHGDQDEIVPVEENTGLVQARYTALSGPITVVINHGGGHQSCVYDARTVVDAILEHTGAAQ